MMANGSTTTARPAQPAGQAKPTAPAAQQAQAQARRMSLANVTTRHKRGPRRIMFYGPEGIGKTSWAAAAPGPIFLAPENGYPEGVAPPAFPEPRNWKDILDAVEELIQAPHDYKTLVLDTVDWIVRDMLYPFICAQHRKNSIDAFEFGAGYKFALAELALLVQKLERLRTTRGVMIILLLHAEQKTYQNPSGPDYDRFIPKLNERLSGMLREWSDLVLFANYQVMLKSKRKEGDDRALTERAKIKGGGARVIFTNPRPEFMAKNRDDLPDMIPLDWQELQRCLSMNATEKREKADKIRAEIRLGLQQLGDVEKSKVVEGWLTKVGDDLGKLATCLNKMQAQLAERMQEQEHQEVIAQQIQAGMRGEEPAAHAPAQADVEPAQEVAQEREQEAQEAREELPHVPPVSAADVDFRPDESDAWEGFGEQEPPPPPPPQDEPPPPPPAAPPVVAQAAHQPQPVAQEGQQVAPLRQDEPQTFDAWVKALYACSDRDGFASVLGRLNSLRAAKIVRLSKEQGAQMRSVVESVKVKLGLEPSQS